MSTLLLLYDIFMYYRQKFNNYYLIKYILVFIEIYYRNIFTYNLVYKLFSYLLQLVLWQDN